MSNRKRILTQSIIITTGVALAVGVVSFFSLYHTAFEQQRERLVETVQSRARLIEAIARFNATRSDNQTPGAAEAATLNQVVAAHAQFRGFGQTGEFVLARREGDQIVFLLSHRHFDLESPEPIRFDSKLAEPMRRALSGQSGTIVGLDYRGEKVLAAYEPVDVLNWGMVAKIDLAEINGAFRRAGVIASLVVLAIVVGGVLLLVRTTNPLVQQIERSEARLQAILDNTTAVIYLKDAEGRYLLINRRFEELFNTTRAQIQGQTDHDLFSKEAADAFRANDLRVLAARAPVEFEEVATQADGPHTYISIKVPLCDAAGVPHAVYGISTDVTDRKRAEAALRESQAFLQTVIDGVPDAVMVIDRDHRIVLANRAAREMAGDLDLLHEPLTCHQVSHHLSTPCPDAVDCPCPLRQAIATRASATVTHTHYDADGNEHVLEIIAVPIFDSHGEVVQIIEACRDVTARVRAEEQARQRRAELAHVTRLATMGEMATGLAHELNQPLAAIVTYLQACLENIRASGGERERLLDNMRRAADQAQRAGLIIERIRNFVRKGEMPRSEVDVNSLVREAIDLLVSELRQHHVQLDLALGDSLPPVRVEPIQIQQVIVNLVRNAVEAMAEQPPAAQHLSIRAAATDGRFVEVAVSDTGPGLPAGEIGRAFDAFFTTKPRGLGMGLAIARSIVEAHGGRLWAANNPEHGATFRFTLPAKNGGDDDEI